MIHNLHAHFKLDFNQGEGNFPANTDTENKQSLNGHDSRQMDINM